MLLANAMMRTRRSLFNVQIRLNSSSSAATLQGPLRTLLFVPGNSTKMLQKSLTSPSDVLVFDLEDSVPEAEKATAREVLGQFLRSEWSSLASSSTSRVPMAVPRVNALRSGHLEKDLEAVLTPQVQGICIGKVDTAQDVHDILSCLSQTAASKQRQSQGLPPYFLIPTIESASAIVNAAAICSADSRVVAAAFGADDYAADMNITRTDEAKELEYARAVIGVSARAARIGSLDTPYPHFKNPEGLDKACQLARSHGFTGSFAIHPSQIEAINRNFSPSEKEVEWSRRIVEAYDEAQKNGRGSTSVDGRMVDAPVVKKARAILATVSQH